MIVVEIKRVSARGRQYDKLLGTAIISNVDATPDGKYGDYDVRVGRKTDAHSTALVYSRPLRMGMVHRHPRLAQNVWRLVLKALSAAFPEQKVVLPDPEAPEHDPDYHDGN